MISLRLRIVKRVINCTLTPRDTARRAIQRRQEQDLVLSVNDFPLSCPDDETLHYILHSSLEHERRILARNLNPDEAVHHKDQDWNGAVAKKKFCTVDSEKVLTDEGWIDYLSNLQASESTIR